MLFYVLIYVIFQLSTTQNINQLQYNKKIQFEFTNLKSYFYLVSDVQNRSQLQFMKFYGQIELNIYIQQGHQLIISNLSSNNYIFTHEFQNENIIVQIKNIKNYSIGSLVIYQYQKIIKLSQNIFRQIFVSNEQLLEIYPEENQLNIQIILNTGIAQITLNRCNRLQRQSCLSSISNLNKTNIMNKHIQHLNIPYCSHCFYAIKITNHYIENIQMKWTSQLIITLISSEPWQDLISRNQKRRYLLYINPSNYQNITIFMHSGQLNISIQDLYGKKNISKSISWIKQLLMLVTMNQPCQTNANGICLLKINFTTSSPKTRYTIYNTEGNCSTMQDGKPKAFVLTKQLLQLCYYNKHTSYVSQLIISYDSSVQFKFSVINTNNHYHRIGRIQSVNNFKSLSTITIPLPAEKGTYILRFQLISGKQINLLNATVTTLAIIQLMEQVIYPSSVTYHSFNIFVLNDCKHKQQLIIIVKKCTSASIKLKYSQANIQMPIQETQQHQIQDLVNIYTHKMHSDTLYLQISTKSYAFYTIQIRKKQKSKQILRLNNYTTKEYKINSSLTDKSTLLLQFNSKFLLKDTRFYLIKGNTMNEVSMRVYCPNNLYGYQLFSTSMNNNIQNISPILIGNILSYELKIDVDYSIIGIYINFNNSYIVPYEIIDTYRWKIYHASSFITLAIIIVFIFFMVLKKNKTQKIGGYTQISSSEIF